MHVGRGPERRQVESLLSAARLGHSGVLVITGEAGIGKTWLLRFAAERASGMRVLTISGSKAEQDLPFAGLAQLRLASADLDRLPPPQAQALGVALALRSGSGVDRFAVGAGLVTWVTQCSEQQPICLLIDDAQLLDRPSQEALAFLARRLLADAAALLATARTNTPCALVAPDLPRLTLSGLDDQATRELLTQTPGDLPSPELVRRIFAISGGNPLAITELAVEADRLRRLPPESPTPIPTALSRLYADRAATLDPQALTAAQIAAAAGEDLGLVSRACTATGVPLAALTAAESAGLLSLDGERVRFVHPLARSGLYGTASPGRRRELHGLLAASVDPADPDRRAWHRVESVIGPDESVAEAMDGVARRAADRAAYAVAATAAERAAGLSASAPVAAERLVTAGHAAWRAGEAGHALELFDRAAARDPAAGVEVRTRRLRGVILARTGALDQARDVLSQAAASAEPSAAIACYAEVVNTCFYLGDAIGALAAAERTLALLDAADPDARTLGWLAAGMGRVLAGEDGSTLLRTGVAELSHRRGSISPVDDAAFLVLGPLFLRDSRSGRDLVRQAIDECRAQAALGSLPHLLFHLARDAAAADRWPNAEADYTEAIGLARELGQSTELAASLAGLAWLESRQGRADDTAAHAAEALELGDRHQINLARIWARYALADLVLGTGEPRDAANRYREVTAMLDDLQIRDVDLSPVPELVEAMRQAGSTEPADDLATSYAVRAASKGQPWARARAARTLGWLASAVELDEHFQAALELHRATLDDFELARTRLAYGARLRRIRRRVDARPHLQAALDIFTRLGARPWADSAARELAATGLAVTRPGDNPVSRLTPRELQIAVLLAEGRTTRETAAALFLSPKTVEYHLRHVYLKLDIESRAALAAALGPRVGS